MKAQIFSIEALLFIIGLALAFSLYFSMQYSVISTSQSNTYAVYEKEEELSFLSAISKNASFLYTIIDFNDGIINESSLSKYLNSLYFPISLEEWVNNTWIGVNGPPSSSTFLPIFITNYSYRNITNYSLGFEGVMPEESAIYKASKCSVLFYNGSKAPGFLVTNESPSSNECTIFVENTRPNYYVVKGYNATGYYLGESEILLGYPGIIYIKK